MLGFLLCARWANSWLKLGDGHGEFIILFWLFSSKHLMDYLNCLIIQDSPQAQPTIKSLCSKKKKKKAFVPQTVVSYYYFPQDSRAPWERENFLERKCAMVWNILHQKVRKIYSRPCRCVTRIQEPNWKGSHRSKLRCVSINNNSSGLEHWKYFICEFIMMIKKKKKLK